MLTMLRISGIKGSIRTVVVFAAAVVAGALFASLPVTIDGGSFDLNSALAVGNGNGNGGVGQGDGRGAVNGGLGGDLSSSMGSLNSARADATAFANASSDSTIGNLTDASDDLMAYLDAVTALETLQTEYGALSLEDQEGAAGEALLEDIADAEDNVEAALADATDALMDAANKDGMIDADVVDAVAGLMEGKLD